MSSKSQFRNWKSESRCTPGPWLLLCADRMEDPVINLPHEHMAFMLGCNRSTVKVAAGDLQRGELIQYIRCKIRILDRPGLERRACECYCTLFDYLHTPADFNEAFPPLSDPTETNVLGGHYRRSNMRSRTAERPNRDSPLNNRPTSKRITGYISQSRFRQSICAMDHSSNRAVGGTVPDRFGASKWKMIPLSS